MSKTIAIAVARLDSWLDTMRGPDGYGGPVAHWWQQSLLYTGAGLDWRYEGIILGYLNLWRKTGQNVWLHKARRAGDDLRNGQLANGHYAASAFELNPATGGTPHEAAADLALLHLAQALKEADIAEWSDYVQTARHNLQSFYVEKLWDDERQTFRDGPNAASYVPNKIATVAEAFFQLSRVTGADEWAERYALPALETVLAHQLPLTAPRLAGAIAQNSLDGRLVEKYFPIYNARCISALLKGYEWTQDEKYLAAARAIMSFIRSCVRPDGTWPTVLYADGSANSGMGWVAALGDILRAGQELAAYGETYDWTASQTFLLNGQDASGGFRTAYGFAAQAGGSSSKGLPDVRDVLHVVGWCDKTFRYLTDQLAQDATLPEVISMLVEYDCVFNGRKLRLTETPKLLEIEPVKRGGPLYTWHKGDAWAVTSSPDFWLH